MQCNGAQILLVDDDPNLRRLLSMRLLSAGHNVETVASGQEALASLASQRADIVITDLRMDEMDGIQLLEEIHRQWPSLPVLVITAHGTIPDAVSATQRGAVDFLAKPVDKNDLLAHVDRALRNNAGNRQEENWAEGIITRSNSMHELLAEARLIANSDSSVLITGESGTGKELLARAIHSASRRSKKPFVALNCSAMPEQLLESELFGHERGAFTDAKNSHIGLFRSAEEGTIFLDEIGDMPLPLQAKLLRVLQDREVRPIGSTRSIPVNVRVLSATHRDLTKAMQEGNFREDLYYRLNVVELKLPSLAERPEDIPLLANHFLRQFSERRGEKPKVFAPEAIELLVRAAWPGNIRQLANIVERTMALATSQVIPAKLVRKSLGDSLGDLPSLQRARDEFMRNYLVQLLQITEGNVSRAARLAERNRSDFYKLLNKHYIDPGQFKS